MQSDIDVDLDELESRLYSQVFHSTEVYEQEEYNPVPPNTDSSNQHITNYTFSKISKVKRYFGDKQPVEDSQPRAENTVIPLETIDCSENEEQHATNINHLSLDSVANAINRKLKRKIRKARQKANRKITKNSVINPVNQARNAHFYNLRSINQQPIDPWQLLFVPMRDRTYTDPTMQRNEPYCRQSIICNNRPDHRRTEMVHRQIYDTRQSVNQTSHVSPLIGMVDNQPLFNIHQATHHIPPLMRTIDNQQIFNIQTGHVPPFSGFVANQPANHDASPLLGNQQCCDSLNVTDESPIVRYVDNQQITSEILGDESPPKRTTPNVHFYDAKWASIKMPISIEDLGLPDLPSPNQAIPVAQSPITNQIAVVKQTIPVPCITNQNLAIVAPVINTEKTILQNLTKQLPTLTSIPHLNPINQSDSNVTHLSDLTNVNQIVVLDLEPDAPEVEVSNKIDDEVIDLSDSDDSVILLPSPAPVIYVVDDSSDELDNVSCNNLELETIDPNCTNETTDIQIISSPDIQTCLETNQPQSNPSTAICKTVNLDTIVTQTSSKASKNTDSERTELLSIPDSNTNDFIENDVDTLNKSRTEFNFNLHGAELDLNRLEKPSPLVSRPDVYETESSCSEAGTVTKIFSEVDFVLPPKEIFCEPNLESFFQFITPNRKGIEPDFDLDLACTTVKSKALKKRHHNQNVTEYESDPTSLVAKKKNKKKKKQKQLEDEASQTNQNTVDSFYSETEVVQHKKKSKRKKLEEDTNEIMCNETITSKKRNIRKKSNEETCEQAELISGNLFNNETEIAQKKKNKRKKIDKNICEQTDDLQSFIKSEPTHQKKKDRRNKLGNVEMCEIINSPTSSNYDLEIVTKKKKEKRKKLYEETSELIEYPTSLKNETEIVTQKKKEKRKKLDDKTCELIELIRSSNNETEIVTPKKKEKRKKLDETSEQFDFQTKPNNETEIATQKKKEKRKKLNEDTCEQIESPRSSKNETDIVTQKKKEKRKKLNEDTCEQIESPRSSKNETDIVTHKKKEKRKKLNEDTCEQIESPRSSKSETEIVTQKKKEKRKKLDEEACEQIESLTSSSNEIMTQKKKEKRKKLETCEQIEPINSNNETENLIQKKKDRRKTQEDETNSEPSDIEKVQIKKRDKRKKIDEEASSQIDAIVAKNIENVIDTQETENLKKIDDVDTSEQVELVVNNSPKVDDLETSEQVEFIVNNPLKKIDAAETSERVEFKENNSLNSDERKDIKDEPTSEQIENNIKTPQVEAIMENTPQESKPVVEPEIDSIKIDCDTEIKNVDETSVQPNSKAGFSFISAWNQIQPSQETSGEDQEIIINNQTPSVPESPQIAETIDSKPVKDGLDILTITSPILKESYPSPKDLESNTDNLEILSPKVTEVTMKIDSDNVTDSISPFKKSQIPPNIELESITSSETMKETLNISKDFQQIPKVIEDNVVESSKEVHHISSSLESKTKKGDPNVHQTSDNVHQLTLLSPIAKESPKISKTPDRITKQIPPQTSQQHDTIKIPNQLDITAKRDLFQASKETPQTSRQSPPIAEISQIPKTPDNNTNKHMSQTLKEVPETSLLPEIPLILKSKIQNFISKTFTASTAKQIPQMSNLPHTSKNAPPIIDLSECDYIPISLETDNKMNPKQTSKMIPTNFVLNVSPPKQSTSKVSTNKCVPNPCTFTNSDQRTFSDFWTDDMKKFYEESWGQENYDIDMVLNSMPSDASKWKIIVEDKYHPRSPRKRGPVCEKCREVGHSRYNCTRFPGPLKCAICGVAGHFHARCPNLMCTSCGNQGGYFTTSCSRCAHYNKIICTLCNSIGHHNTKCPDLWRRYHLTTEDLPILNSAIVKLKPHNKRWCSNCARRGHLQNVCTFRSTEHFTAMPHIISYDPCYGRISNISPAVQPENIPTVLENTNLAQIRNYKNKMVEFNKSRYFHLLRVLKQQCRGSNLPYIPEIERMERALQRDQNPKSIIGNVYKLRSLIQKGNMWK